MSDTKNRQDLILEFWFHDLSDSVVLDKNSPTVRQWFVKDPRIDSEIREKFELDLRKAGKGEYSSWEVEVRGRLALILLYDQFSRNMYRDTPKMFATDPLALGLTLRTIAEKRDGQIQLVERLFFYMPLMHSEVMERQKFSVECFTDLVRESKHKSPRNSPYYEYTLDFAKRHHAIVEQFGRFPHRNLILNRPSTPEELEFLKRPSSKF